VDRERICRPNSRTSPKGNLEKEKGVTFQKRTTTFERGYAADLSQSGGSASTTLSHEFHFETEPVEAIHQPMLPVQDRPASSLCAYLGQDVIEGGAGLGTVTEEDYLHHEPRANGFHGRRGNPSRRERYAQLISLIETWLADESDYDESVWPQLKAGIEDARTSARKRFSE